jgi:F-type H+-transporting ATPase subunit b
MKPGLLAFTQALGLAAALTTGVALGQQPQPPGAQPAAPGAQPQAPGAQPQPPARIQRIDPSQLPPAFQRPGGPGAPPVHGGMPPAHGGLPGGPGARPGGMPSGHPGLPPGFKPHGKAEPEEHGGHGEHCPGHGPDDPPPPPNWWRGLLMVHNERAQSPSVVNQLFFRYENTNDPCDPKNQPPPFLASVLNVGILALILYRFGRKPLAEALVKRKAAIMGEIDIATRLKEDARIRLREYEEKFERMEETLEQIHREYGAQAEQENKHLLVEAEERRVRMRRDAEFLIEQELKSARAELLEEAVANAVIAAEKLLAAKMGPSDLDRLADDYLGVVGSALSGKGKAAGASAEGVRR